VLTTYLDTSALVPICVPESVSRAARSVVLDAGQVPFTALHRLEVANAFEQLVGRGLITRRECGAIQAQFADDLESRRLSPIDLDFDQVFLAAGELAQRHTAKLLARSLDLLHVAAAHSARCTKFVSADDRQLAVARASGLTPIDIKRSSRRRK
jgi:predicted nucleic acid-binding protein